jgi:hypothetical protein
MPHGMAAFMPDLLPAANAQIVRTRDSTVHIWHPAPTVFVSRVEGVLSEQVADAMLVAGQRVIAADGKMLVFNDWENATSYARKAREQMTRSGLQLRRQVEATHFLVRARILALGIQLANIVMGNMKVHPTRASLETAIRQAVAARTARAAS